MGGGGGILWFIRKPAALEVAPNDAPGKHDCNEHRDVCEEMRNGKRYKWESCSICGRRLTQKVEVRP